MKRSNKKQLDDAELNRRLSICERCVWWVPDKFFCRLNWLIAQGEWSYRRLCAYDPNFADRFTPKEEDNAGMEGSESQE